MKTPLVVLAILLGIISGGLGPAAAAPPVITGVWTGTAYLSYDTSYGQTPMTMEITHQLSFRFRGTVTFPPPYGDGLPGPINGIISNDGEIHITASRSVTASGQVNNLTTPTKINGYFNHLEEEHKPAHTGKFILEPAP
jgi:hypothetical protein